MPKLDTRPLVQAWAQDMSRRATLPAGAVLRVVRDREKDTLRLMANYDAHTLALANEAHALAMRGIVVPQALASLAQDAQRISPFAMAVDSALHTLDKIHAQMTVHPFVARLLAKVERERAALGVQRLQIRQELSQAWILAQAIEQRDQVLTGLLSENQRLQDSLTARIAGGTAQAGDLLMARQEALALSDRRDDLQRDRSKARAMLRRWVGARADEALQGTPGPLSRPLDQLRAEVHRHAELAQYPAMQAMALAETREAQAETKGDWSWEVAYSRRDRRWGDMVSFQVTFDLPWQQERRQGPQIKAKQLELQRLEAEQEDVTRRHLQELEDSASELAALNSQIERLQSAGMGLAQGRAELALANYQSAKGDLSAVLAARAQVRETHWRLIELQAQRDTVIARLNSLIAD
ncbi:MAG: heavy metal RND transporter [Acidovorax sp.]|nr:MAG: heavy metal RND transporter [Acidovorax sp.]